MAISDEDIVSNIHTDFEKMLAEQALSSELNSYTTAERDALSPTAPRIIFNSSTGIFEGWDGASWLALDNVPVQGNLTTHIADGEAHGISTFGSTLVDDADASTARTTLDVYSKGETDTEIDTDISTHNAVTTAHGISAFGSTLVDDVDATTARATLEIESVQGYVWSKIVGPTNATDRNGYLMDSSGGIFTVTLPTSPSVGDTIAFVDLGSANTNNITIARNGTNIDGAAEDLTVDTNKSYFKLMYADATIGWALSDVGQVAA